MAASVSLLMSMLAEISKVSASSGCSGPSGPLTVGGADNTAAPGALSPVGGPTALFSVSPDSAAELTAAGCADSAGASSSAVGVGSNRVLHLADSSSGSPLQLLLSGVGLCIPIKALAM